MQKLNELSAGSKCIVCVVNGTKDFQRRITAVGLTPGCKLEIVKNEGKYPLLIDARNTILALNRTDCGEIMVEVAQ